MRARPLPNLTRALAAAVLLVLACRSFAGSEQDITLQTPTGTIAGSLALPDGTARHPVVLLIAGSGPTDRNGNGAGSRVHPDTLRLLAAALADAGFASVRYDKRGVGASAAALAREEDIRFDTYVDDAAAWVARLADDSRFSGVAIAGHSEGSTIGMLAARRGGVVAFVSLDGPARGAAAVLRTQLKGKLPPELVAKNDEILDALQAGHVVDTVPAVLAPLYRASVQPYLISWFRQVPADAFARLEVPSLVAQGDLDSQVGVAEAEALHAANPRSELLIVPGMTHTLKPAPPGPSGAAATYLDPALPIAPALVHGVTDFLSKRTAATSARP